MGIFFLNESGGTYTHQYAWRTFGDGWMVQQTNVSTASETVYWDYANASEYSTKYWWKVLVDSATGATASAEYHFTTEASAEVIYNTTIRNDGIDYFVWLGGNTTASVVDNNITGFDEAAENISIWRNGTWGGSSLGNWVTWTGEGGGTDFNIYTFDVVRVYLTDSDTQTFNMTANADINYAAARTVTLLNDSITKGGNYTSFTDAESTNLSSLATTISLDAGESIWLWNETTFIWDAFIVGFYEPDIFVHEDDVIFTKVEDSESWAIGGK